MSQLLIGLALLALLAVCVWGARRYFFPQVNADKCAWNSWATATPGVHETTLGKKADAAIIENLLVTTGTDEWHVAVCGSADVPLGVTLDSADAAEDPLTIGILGRGPTKLLTASEAIGDGVLVYQAAGGKIAASGTNLIGVSLQTSAGNNSIIEVDTANAASSASPGIPASTYDANSTVIAVTDNTPVALPFAASTIFARLASGNIIAATVAQIQALLDYALSRITATPVAAAGSTVADAGQLGSSRLVYLTSDSSAKGVKLPTGIAGMEIKVINTSSTAAKIYAASGGTLNGGSADAAKVIPASKGTWCFCSAADTWTVFDMTALSS